MPDLFHNPYHFVPAPKQDGPGLSPRDVQQWPEHLRHDRFVGASTIEGQFEEVFSGRVVCRAVIQELLAVGNTQAEGQKPSKRGANDGAVRRVNLFKLGSDYALPGSALRGMFSALAEAASNSTLKVLADNPLTLKPNGGVPTTPGGTTHDFFRKRNPNLVPLQTGDGRTTLTLAEQLFGVVEITADGQKHTGKQQAALALASRLRVSHALAHGNAPTEGSEAISKILGSPKFRYPSFYFNATDDGEFISRDKNELSLNKGHFPKGRKFYLHRQQLCNDDWISKPPHDPKTINQKTCVTPLETGEFWFHFDFDNLSRLELELLCYVITPAAKFFHKLGLGKPLGLGKLKIEPAGVFLVKRLNRYGSDALGDPRYSSVWKDPAIPGWPKQYGQEANLPATAGAKSPPDLRDDYRQRIKDHFPDLLPVLRAIELLGNSTKITSPVHYPQIPGQDLESRLFLWFQRNESQMHPGQFLRSLTDANTCGFTELPALERAPSSSPPDPSCWIAGRPPAHLLPPKEMTPADYEGKTDVPFRVAEIKPNGKMRFEIEIAGKAFLGFLPPNDLILLRSQDLEPGDFVHLDVVKFNAGSFQLRFKKPAPA